MKRGAALTGLLVLALAIAATAAARMIVFGHSVRGRPLSVRVMGPNSAKRKILLVGCIHGNECAGLRIIRALEHLRRARGVQLWLVGELNPDGTAAGTRQNAHGVDLNRNFPYQWRHVSDPTYYSGPPRSPSRRRAPWSNSSSVSARR